MSSFAPSVEVEIPVLSTGYFYWLLMKKWHCKSKIASDVKENIGNVTAEAPPGGDRFHLLRYQAHFKGVLVQFQEFGSLSCTLYFKNEVKQGDASRF